jgi:hypothetical protein
MRRAASIGLGILASALLVAVGAGLAGPGLAGAGPPSEAFPLYSAGERVDELPLAAVLRRDDTSRYVSFVYGDCVASSDAGCAPPAEIQVWPACRRNLALYEGAESGGGPVERLTLRGVPAALFDDGTRLELETDRSTIVVFAGTRGRALRLAAALRSLDDSVPPGHPLPKPARSQEGGEMGC